MEVPQVYRTQTSLKNIYGEIQVHLTEREEKKDIIIHHLTVVILCGQFKDRTQFLLTFISNLFSSLVLELASRKTWKGSISLLHQEF